MKIIKKISEKIEIQELQPDELKSAYPLVKQLRQSLTVEAYLKIVAEMSDYRVFVLLENGQMLAYAGFGQAINLYDGRHLFLYELVTDAANRSRGFGELLLEVLEEEGQRLHCENLVLTSGLQRLDAHRFYEEKVGLTKVSFAFRKKLSDESAAN